jgi:tetratricopeptide (TPR) repeat protein
VARSESNVVRAYLPSAFFAAALLAAAPAKAQLLADWRTCLGDNASGALQQINGCTGVIQSKLEIPPHLAVAYFNRGVLFQDQGALDRALTDYEAALRLDPTLAEAYAGRGAVRYARAAYAQAEADYDAAIQLKPSLLDGWLGRAAARAARGDQTGALADYD